MEMERNISLGRALIASICFSKKGLIKMRHTLRNKFTQTNFKLLLQTASSNNFFNSSFSLAT